MQSHKAQKAHDNQNSNGFPSSKATMLAIYVMGVELLHNKRQAQVPKDSHIQNGLPLIEVRPNSFTLARKYMVEPPRN